MLRYACYEPLHVPHLSLFILGLHPFPFFSLQTRDKLSCSKCIENESYFKRYMKKESPAFFLPIILKRRYYFVKLCFLPFYPCFSSACLRRCQRRVWRYSFCYKCRLLSYAVLTATVLTFAHFCNE